MRICVTGSEGFIAGHLLAAIADHHDVLLVDEALGQDVRDTSAAEAIAFHDPELVFHLAAKHFVPWCRENPEETWDVNVNGTEAVMAACGPSLKAFVLASSAAVYGFDAQRRSEIHPTRPADIYGQSKVGAEGLLAHLARQRSGVRAVAARLFNVVGTGDGNPHLIPELVRQVVAGETVLQVGNLGSRRDYIHVDDVAGALLQLAAGADPGFSRYNVASGSSRSTAEVVQILAEVAGAPLEAHQAQGLVRETDGDLMGNPTRLQVLGWRTKSSLRSALEECLAEVSA